MKSRLSLLILVLLVSLLLAACNRAEVTNVQRSADGGVDATVILTESEVNTLVQEVLAAGDNPLLRNPQIDLQPGKIIINGEHDQRDGGGTVNGSLTVEVTVVDGKMQATVTAASIEGLDLSDARITAFNERLANIFARRAERDRGAFTVKSVTINDSELTAIVNLQRP